MNINELVKPIYDKWAIIDNSVNTFCNMFLNSVMLTQDYHAFEGKTANGILSIIQFERFNWKKIEPSEWDQESIVVAGRQDEPHGHVNILIPGEFIKSGKWNKLVPLVANIGRDNFFGKGQNYAFGKTEPDYYLYIG